MTYVTVFNTGVVVGAARGVWTPPGSGPASPAMRGLGRTSVTAQVLPGDGTPAVLEGEAGCASGE